MTQPRCWPLKSMAIGSDADVVIIRQCARKVAEDLGFDRQDQTRIATAVSEIVRNAWLYAGGGNVHFTLDGEATPQSLVIRVEDSGPGIADLDAIFTQKRAQNGAGLGLAGARRLLDGFEIVSEQGRGTTAVLTKHLPGRAARISQDRFRDLMAALNSGPDNMLGALREQNLELVHNLDELRRRQEEAEQLNRELGDTNRGVVALYAELEERADELRRASELKSRFLAHMSHEFRTPLNSILALSRMLLDRLDGEINGEQERQVSYIRRSAESLLDLVNDLLDLSKVEAGKVEVKPHRFTVTELFSGLRGALKPLQVNPAVELYFDAAPDIPRLFTDEAKVAQILRNLISNALKFTEKGQVGVSARYHLETSAVIFAVRDTGIGIAPADQSRIFEEFTQIDTRLQRGVKGTGLGLPLSRNLAVLLGGDIALESAPGQGSVFRFTLPAVFHTPLGDASGPTPAPKVALLVDDDDAFRYVIRQLISSHPDFTPIEAQSGREAVRMAREAAPAVIFLDLLMPDMDGFAVLQSLQADPATWSIPVVVTTSLPINDALRERLPPNVPLLSKQLLSRESVGKALTEATETGMAR
jgi:signal transduction histidine kinase/CheY-like chemotaxis protein